MRSSFYYDVIIVYETDFQKSIVEILVPNYYKGKRVLLVDARNFQVKCYGRCFSLNLNGFKNSISSIGALISFPVFRTDELVCTAFTGINSRLFPAIIKYNHLVLLDDGSGTPAILKSGKYPWSKKYKIRFWSASMLLYLVKGKMLGSTKALIKKADKYYSIYNFVDEGYSGLSKHLDITHIDYFSKYTYTIIFDDVIGFVSNGCGNKSKILQDIFVKTGNKPVYYPHPHEDISCVDVNLVQRIERPDSILESYFMNTGIPAKLFGDPSTVFINLIQAHFPAECITIYYDKRIVTSAYYDIFKGLGVNMIENNETV